MTAKRILVPLDGDERSENIVPLVAGVARDSGATVRLLRVYPIPERREGPHGRTVEYVDQGMSRLTGAGRDALAREEARLSGVPVETVVRFGERGRRVRCGCDRADRAAAWLAAPSARRQHGRARGASRPRPDADPDDARRLATRILTTRAA